MRLILAITGASGIELGKRFIKYLPKEIELHLIVSKNAKIVGKKEKANIRLYSNKDIGAAVASGSFRADAMAIIPTSMNTLGKVANGIADNLVTRAALVMIKEQRKLLLAPRELPFSPILLENMLKLSQIGVIIAPPVLGYYSGVKKLKDAEKFIIGKWYDSLGIEHNLYRRWKGE
ncbi:MAG: UbiX family flavin prenyltransferase [Epsilonproteobacteria bacterium]|nr:UbiX family flavin prenyltransferase [Campylobacterota bacterium]